MSFADTAQRAPGYDDDDRRAEHSAAGAVAGWGDDTDRKVARGALIEVILARLARRREPHDVTRQQCVRHAEIRRLTLSLFAAGCELKANTVQLQEIVDDLFPGLTERRGIGPVGAAQAIVSLSHPSTVPKQRGTRARRIQFAASQQRSDPPT